MSTKLTAIATALILSTCAAIAQKANPTGIFQLLSFDDTVAELNSVPWTDSNLTGVAARVPWSSIETSNGVFYWNYIDRVQTRAQAEGKRWSLCIGCGVDAPSWVLSSGTTFDVAGRGHVPAPWDSTYQGLLNGLLQAIAARYDSDPTFAYVIMSGVGYLDSCSLCQSTNNNTELNNTVYGGLSGATLWAQAFQTIAGLYITAFQQTPIVVNFYSFYYPGNDSQDQSDTYYTITQYLGNAPSRWGVKWNNLTPSFTDPTSQIPFQLIELIETTNPTGLQPEKAGDSYAKLQSVANQVGAGFLELYAGQVP